MGKIYVVPHYQSSDGARLAFRTAREGSPPLVFLHGWQADGRIWGPLMTRLAERRQTFALDLRGSGDSAEAPGPYNVRRYAADVAEFIASQHLGPVILAGHSMGAAVALRVAIDHPESVRGAVLIAAVPPSGIPFPPKVLDFLRSLPGNAERTGQWLRGLTFAPMSDDVFALLAAAAADTPTEVALESFASWQPGDFSAEAARITAPVLVLAPVADRPMTPELQRERILEVVPGSRLIAIEDAGHYAPLECPDALASLIEAFVEGLAL